MMRIAWLALPTLLAVGCKKENPDYCDNHPGEQGCDGVMVDGDVVDENMIGDDVMPDALSCYGQDTFQVCFNSPPAGPVAIINPTSINTDMGATNTPPCSPAPASWIMNGQSDACFIVGESVTINANVTVSGARPLVILSSTTLTVNATIDAASRPGRRGPGAPGMACKNPATNPTGGEDGGGGGAGGSFMSAGGNGGLGEEGTANNAGGQAATADSMAPTALRAGCNGQTGGTGQGTVGAGPGGLGGGAIYLVAGGSISLSATTIINVSGQGGVHGGRQGGGGGGGSGGMIVLYAPSITAAAGSVLMANGGGGGSGGEDTAGTNPGGGANGEEPDPGNPTTRADGGIGTNNAGDGGKGFAQQDATTPLNATNGAPGADNRGGGAGGGGKGYIKANVALPDATTSPVADTP